MFSKVGLIVLAALGFTVASPTIRNAEQRISYTSDPENIAYAQNLERIIADGVTGNTTIGTELEKRVDPYCTFLDGNGDPHQNPRHTQISRTGTCGSGPCSISLTAGQTETYSWSWGLNPPGSWINGGFAVSESEQVSESFTCNGTPGETICIWSTLQTTAYTVANYDEGRFDSCGRQVGTSIIFSPNTCFNTPSYYCVGGANNCRTKDQFYYDTANAPAGGPPTC